MRQYLFAVMTFALLATANAAPRTDSSPLAKAPRTVAPCLQDCEAEFARCESQPQVTSDLCPQSRRVCLERCDPAVLSSDTLKGLKRTPEELRYKPLNPQTPFEQCRQVCQDRRAICLGQNQAEACDPATSACYSRCDENRGAAPAKPKPKKPRPPKAKPE